MKIEPHPELSFACLSVGILVSLKYSPNLSVTSLFSYVSKIVIFWGVAKTLNKWNLGSFKGKNTLH